MLIRSGCWLLTTTGQEMSSSSTVHISSPSWLWCLDKNQEVVSPRGSVGYVDRLTANKRQSSLLDRSAIIASRLVDDGRRRGRKLTEGERKKHVIIEMTSLWFARIWGLLSHVAYFNSYSFKGANSHLVKDDKINLPGVVAVIPKLWQLLESIKALWILHYLVFIKYIQEWAGEGQNKAKGRESRKKTKECECI